MSEFRGSLRSNAICLALAERHPEAGLVPQGRELRERFWQSLSLSASTLESPVVMYFLSNRGVTDAAWAPLCAKLLKKRLPAFAAVMPAESYTCGDFSIADICAGYVLRIGVQAGLLSLEGQLEGYLRRLMTRPAAQAARLFERFGR